MFPFAAWPVTMVGLQEFRILSKENSTSISYVVIRMEIRAYTAAVMMSVVQMFSDGISEHTEGRTEMS